MYIGIYIYVYIYIHTYAGLNADTILGISGVEFGMSILEYGIIILAMSGDRTVFHIPLSMLYACARTGRPVITISAVLALRFRRAGTGRPAGAVVSMAESTKQH